MDLEDERLSEQQVHRIVLECDVCVYTDPSNCCIKLSMKESLRLALSLYLCEQGFSQAVET